MEAELTTALSAEAALPGSPVKVMRAAWIIPSSQVLKHLPECAYLCTVYADNRVLAEELEGSGQPTRDGHQLQICWASAMGA